MSIEALVQNIPAFVLIFFRVAGMLIFAPVIGSSRIPRRLRVMIALVLAMGLMPAVAPPIVAPQSSWELAVGIGGEMLFGLAMGMILNLVFVAAQWAGELAGQQMGINLGEVFDPQFGHRGSLIGDLYFMLTLAVFLIVRGHHAMLRGVRASFESLPLLSIAASRPLLDLLAGFLQSATVLAVQVAAPMLVTMLIVDLALGFIGRTMPQLNVLSAGLSLRAVVGMLMLLICLILSSDVIREAILDSMREVEAAWIGVGNAQ